MNSRERVLTGLSHSEPDRTPRDLGSTESTGMTVGAYRNLLGLLGVTDVPTVFEPFQYVSHIAPPLLDRFKIDAENLTPGPKRWTLGRDSIGRDVRLPDKWCERVEQDGSTVALNINGDVIGKRPFEGAYFDSANPPLATVSSVTEMNKHRETIASFDLPAFADESLAELTERGRKLRENGRCVVFNLCCHLLAAGQLLRGYENFMIDLMCEKTMAETLLDALVESYVDRAATFAESLRGVVDVVLLNDDLGTQNGPMLSPDLYRNVIKPRQKTLFTAVKRLFEAPLLFHSCGSIREFLPDLIDVGVDAINPVQLSAHDMKPEALKRDFGDQLTFWGGGVDTQSVLNRLGPNEVKDAVKRNVDIFAAGGGFVFSQVHNVQPDVPPENVMAMFEALDDY